MYTLETEFQGFPDRDKLKYNEIENSEDYELLSCIAYEAAIRVPEIKTELLNFYKNLKDLTTEAHEKKYSKDTLSLRIQDLYQKSLLNKFGFDQEATMFFVLKQDDPGHKIKSKVLTSTPNRFMVSKHGDIIELIKEKDGTITRKCLNSARIAFEQILRFQKLQEIEDMEVLQGTYNENTPPVSEEPIEYEEYEFEEFLQNEESILEEIIVDEESLESFEKLLEYRQIRRSMNWTEFNSAPILNLELSMRRPIIKRRVMHKYLSPVFNFNLPIKELQEQLKVHKEVYDQYAEENKNIDDEYLSPLRDRFPSNVEISTMPSCHRSEYLLTAGEIGCTDTFFEPSGGKSSREDIEYIDFFKYHDAFKEDEIETAKIYADIFYLYDCLKILEKHNKHLGEEKIKLTDTIKFSDWSEENKKELHEELDNDFNKKIMSKTQTSLLLYEKIRVKDKENRGMKSKSGKPPKKSTLVYKYWKYGKKLIDEGMYKSLM